MSESDGLPVVDPNWKATIPPAFHVRSPSVNLPTPAALVGSPGEIVPPDASFTGPFTAPSAPLKVPVLLTSSSLPLARLNGALLRRKSPLFTAITPRKVPLPDSTSVPVPILVRLGGSV